MDNEAGKKSKKCVKCNSLISVDEFYKNSSRKDGLQTECKACSQANALKWRLANPDKFKTAVRQWREAHPEKLRAYNHKQYLKRKNASKASQDTQ